MKKATIVLFCGIALLSTSELTRAGQESGLYIGASGGRSDIKVSSDNFDFKDNDTAYKAFAGYNFGVIPLINLGVEGSYVDFGTVSSSKIFNANVDITGWDLFGVAGLNLGPFGIFGKVGQIWWNSDANLAQGSLDDSGNDMAYGVGALFQLGSLAFRAEYEYFDFDLADVGFVSVGMSWTF